MMSFKISDNIDVGNTMYLFFFSQQPDEVGIAVLSFTESSRDSSAEEEFELRLWLGRTRPHTPAFSLPKWPLQV